MRTAYYDSNVSMLKRLLCNEPIRRRSRSAKFIDHDTRVARLHRIIERMGGLRAIAREAERRGDYSVLCRMQTLQRFVEQGKL